MNPTPYGRNEAIYEDWMRGDPQSTIAKKHGLSSQRIHQICLKQDRLRRKPYVNEIIARKYPEFNSRSISAAVNALMRYWSRNNYISGAVDKTTMTFDQFVQLLMETEEEGELAYIRGLGDVGLAFLRRMLEDENNEN